MEPEITSRSFNPISHVEGELLLPGDKSISHRALIFSAMSDGSNTIENLSTGDDVKSTILCLIELGVSIYKNNKLTIVNGRGFKGFSEPSKELYAGNSGTTARLLTGLLSMQNFPVTLTGDASLSRRPMSRIIEPLSLMGVKIKSESGTLPLHISPSENHVPVDYKLLIPSAQVKSAIILAGLHLEEDSKITEYIQSRDHTERMLNLKVLEKERKYSIHFSTKDYPRSNTYLIPSDISSAIFFIVLTLLTPDSELIIKNVTLNPTRKGIVDILVQMGGDIELNNVKIYSGEPSGDLIVRTSNLKNIEINPEIIPNIIDEIPALVVAGIFAEGDFSLSGAGELRYKESDRITSVCENLKKTGLKVEEYVDGLSVSGKMNNDLFKFNSFGDHRIAMAFSILSMLSEKGGIVEDFGCVNISNPQFINQIESVTY